MTFTKNNVRTARNERCRSFISRFTEVGIFLCIDRDFASFVWDCVDITCNCFAVAKNVILKLCCFTRVAVTFHRLNYDCILFPFKTTSL